VLFLGREGGGKLGSIEIPPSPLYETLICVVTPTKVHSMIYKKLRLMQYYENSGEQKKINLAIIVSIVHFTQTIASAVAISIGRAKQAPH